MASTSHVAVVDKNVQEAVTDLEMGVAEGHHVKALVTALHSCLLRKLKAAATGASNPHSTPVERAEASVEKGVQG